MIPDLGNDGNLPPGVHQSTWDEFCRRFGTSPHRRRLIAGLRRALLRLKGAGATVVYINGSFVTDRAVPADYDACWSVAGVDPTRLDPVLLDFTNRRAAQKAKFMGELFPAELQQGASGKTWSDFFQIDKATGKPKGIVAIDLRNLR